MASNINVNEPPQGAATTLAVRNNFVAAKAEIEALQAGTTPIEDGELAGGQGATPHTWSIDKIAQAVALFQDGVDPTPGRSPLWTDGSLPATTLTAKAHAVIACHKDDEILWMLPGCYTAERIAIVAEPMYDTKMRVVALEPAWFRLRQRWTAGHATDAAMTAFFRDAALRRQFYDKEVFRPRIQALFSDPTLTDFITHNPWGEYGHQHHRTCYELCVEAALAFGKTLWIDSVYIAAVSGQPGGATSENEYTEANLTDSGAGIGAGNGLKYINGDMVRSDFALLKAPYTTVDATAPALPAWTWSALNPKDQPYKFYRVVNAGVSEVKPQVTTAMNALKAALPFFGCPTTTADCSAYPP